MLLYNCTRSNALPVSAQDFLTISGNATRSYCILELDCEGAGTASAYTEMGVFRTTTVGVTPTNTTAGNAGFPTPVNPAQPAAGFTTAFVWTTQPVLPATPFHTMPVNSNGQRYFWRAMPNLSNALWSPGGGLVAAASVSFRPITISGNITLRAQVGEI